MTITDEAPVDQADAPTGLRVIGYTRVSTAEQASSGAGLEAQRSAIGEACSQRGYVLTKFLDDAGWSGGSLERPGIAAALVELDKHRADALMVSKLDRLSRSLLDFAGLMERARRRGWALIALDLGVDTSTPAGEMMASVMASVAQWERRAIGQRTKDALAVKRAQGVRLGRARVIPAEIADRIVAHRADGLTLAAIADTLNSDRIPTAGGGAAWYPSTVRSVLAYTDRDRQAQLAG